MSRDAFSHDPQDARDPSTPRSVRRHRSIPSRPRDDGNSRSETTVRQDHTDPREAAVPRDTPSLAERAYYVRDRAYLLRDSEIHSLKEIGKFRVIATADLARYAYGGDSERMGKEVERLEREHLVSEKTLEISRKKTLRVVTLTKAGHRLLKRTNELPDDQAIYYGLVKSREAQHHADLYRLYQKEVTRIERSGGRPVRVVLDYELKKRVFHDVAKLGPEKHSAESKREIAEKHGLQLVRGKIPLPDLRIEYEGRDGDMARVDLELATEHYRGSNLAEKVRAGFSLYARAQDAPGLRRVLDQKELTAEILSL